MNVINELSADMNTLSQRDYEPQSKIRNCNEDVKRGEVPIADQSRPPLSKVLNFRDRQYMSSQCEDTATVPNHATTTENYSNTCQSVTYQSNRD